MKPAWIFPARVTRVVDGDTIRYKYVAGSIDREKRTCELTISAPDSPQAAAIFTSSM